MKDIEQLSDHKVRAGPDDIKVIGHLDFKVTHIDDDGLWVKEIGGEGLTTPLPLDIFKGETEAVPDESWIGRTVKLVRRRVEKEWVSWEL